MRCKFWLSGFLPTGLQMQAKAVEGTSMIYTMKDGKAVDLTGPSIYKLSEYCFLTHASTEAIFCEQSISYPESVHGYDAYKFPAQLLRCKWTTHLTNKPNTRLC